MILNDEVVESIAKTFSLRDYNISYDTIVESSSGIEHTFDFILFSRSGKKKVSGLIYENKTVNDLFILNAASEDCDIRLKVVVVDHDLDDVAESFARMYNIIIADTRNSNALSSSLFGIYGLDARIKSTMKPGNVYMISGKAGVGKTTASTQFLVNGAKLGEKGAIILSDMRSVEYITNAKSFSFGFGTYYGENLIEVLELSDQIKEMKYNAIETPKDYRKYITKLITEIKQMIVSYNIKRLVIDPITPLLIENEDFINLLFNSLALPDIFIIVTSGLRESDLSVFGMEEYYVSGVIKMEYNANTHTRRAYIAKMRGGPVDLEPFLFKITKEGILPADREEGWIY